MEMKQKVEVPAGLALLYVVLALAMVPVNYIIKGYVLTVLWGWFITPAFGLAVPSLVLAIGVALVISYVTYQYNDAVTKERNLHEQFFYTVGTLLISPWAWLLVGYIIHRFV